MGKPGDACLPFVSSWLTPRWTRMEAEGEGDAVGTRESCGLCWIFARRYSGQGEWRWRNRDSWTDGDLERDWQGEWKRNWGKEIDRCRDKQTVVVGGRRSQRQPWGAGGKQWSKKTLNSIIVIQLAFLRVLWTTILADLLQTQLLAKSWPRRLRGRPGRCGSFLRCLSQHGWRFVLTVAQRGLSTLHLQRVGEYHYLQSNLQTMNGN